MSVSLLQNIIVPCSKTILFSRQSSKYQLSSQLSSHQENLLVQHSEVEVSVCGWSINNVCSSIVRWQKERASISCAASLMKPVDSGCN